MAKPAVTFSTATPNPGHPNVFDVTAEELEKKLGQVRLVDVRRPDEIVGELGHIKGIEHVVLDSLPQHIDELPKDETIVFVCRSGARSGQATAFALEHGFEQVYNLKGGMLRWNELGLAKER